MENKKERTQKKENVSKRNESGSGIIYSKGSCVSGGGGDKEGGCEQEGVEAERQSVRSCGEVNSGGTGTLTG